MITGMIGIPERWKAPTLPGHQNVERKLAAILAADVVGYSRMMAADEVRTLQALKAHRKVLIDPTIAAHGGTIVKTTGDGLLVVFGSAVDGVACAVAIQRGMIQRNSEAPDDKRFLLRIGINVGDVIFDGKDIFGDGVNIAARLETLCEPGGLCISHTVKDQIGEKLPLAFVDCGEKTVKNIPRPLHVFAMSPQAISSGPDIPPGSTREPRRPARTYAIATVAIAIAVAGAIGWGQLHRSTPVPQASSGPPAPENAAPQRVSIAVLPLLSLSAPAQDDYFADGLTEDIISALGRFSDMSVRSRNSVFAYKDKSPRPEEVGRDLNVRYVVEGSVRRNPERIRVAIRLTEAAHGNLVWSENYDALPKDIFSVQEDITRRIVGTLAVRISSLEAARVATKPPSSLEAYDLALRGRSLYARATRTSVSQARPLFEKAIDLDPKYVSAYVELGFVELKAVTEGWTSNPPDAVQRAEALAAKAITIDETSAGGHALLGAVHLRRGNYDRALDELRRAVALNSSDPESYNFLGAALLFTGDFEGAIRAIELSSEFQPSLSATTFFNLGAALLLSGRAEDAIRTFERSTERYPGSSFPNAMLAAAYAVAGRTEDAARQASEVRQRFPYFSSSNFGSQFRNPEDREKIASALKKAGL
ncbi:MAG: adenylate/guanylate cyclase domain-containing protein [Bradyrhizobium sp.]